MSCWQTRDGAFILLLVFSLICLLEFFPGCGCCCHIFSLSLLAGFSLQLSTGCHTWDLIILIAVASFQIVWQEAFTVIVADWRHCSDNICSFTAWSQRSLARLLPKLSLALGSECNWQTWSEIWSPLSLKFGAQNMKIRDPILDSFWYDGE